jgi:peptidoglycan/xylan/chitin deacetylase (PgdA/CDA1 family)
MFFLVSMFAFENRMTVFLTTVFGAIIWCSFLMYASFFPTSGILFGKTYYKGRGKRKQVALTFDDGPHPDYTHELLDILSCANVKGTFFIVGKNALACPDIVKRIHNEGHAIGNHSWSHALLGWSNLERITSELDSTQRILTKITGVAPELFRPPFGNRDRRVLEEARKKGLETILWSVTAFDWKCPGADKIMRIIMKRVKPGAIILLHDGAEKARNPDRLQTVEVVRRIIPVLRSRGYNFVTVPEMMND